jgi:glycosyltransferase involved in cell wall biosynthesis
MIINGFEYIPQAERKNILLLSDDLRLTSGVGVVSRKFVMGTAHRYNWFQLGAAINHPDIGKRIDVSADINTTLGITDAKVIVQPNNGYGNPDIVRALLREFKFDAILHYTDPRQWIWLYHMEHELRQEIPIFFYHVWDNLPYPMYNYPYYLSCDWIGCISKQTQNIVNNVAPELKDWQVTYVPHGIDEKEFYPITQEEPGLMREIEVNGVKELKSDYELMLKYRDDLDISKFDFIILYNNRNIRRKMMGDVVLAFKTFCDKLTEEQAKKCALVMHTQIVDENGTDLMAVGKAIAPKYNVIYYDARITHQALNYLYNIADVTINMASAEGFGLGTAESLMAGTPIIATVTGGMQDQMGFKDENGQYVKFHTEWGSNHDGKYKNHGEWVYPLYPAARGLVGSPPTPYIFDDRVRWEDAAEGLLYWYNMSREQRKQLGLKGKDFMLQEIIGMQASEMCRRFMNDMEQAWKNLEPRKRFELITVSK